MNNETGNGPAPGHVHPNRGEFADAALALGNDLLVRLQEQALERYPDWCPARRTQMCYEAACVHLGLLDGAAVVHGVSRQALDQSLRGGMRTGRTLALEGHHATGCDRCEGTRDLERLLAVH